tara:strand:+ start:3429 stop:3890 length:462 start_codon:yes stop_codon:yes gene_type:complete
MKFKRIGFEEEFDVAEYVKGYLRLNSEYDTKIYLGTDSQNKTHHTNYATTLVFHLGNTGCHVIYTKERVKTIPIHQYWSRLWGEVERSVKVALYLRDHGIEIDSIGLDFNSDPKRKSHKLVKSALGYVESFGFKGRVKPDMLPAIKAADDLAR